MLAARVRPLSLVLLLLGACTSGKPDVEVDGWELARMALLDGESCYAERPEYCISDPAFVDKAIQSALDARWQGQMPKPSREVDQVIRSARVHYTSASKSPERLAEIEGLVAAYYAAPKVDASSDASTVNVDLGALPGKLAVRGRASELVLGESNLIEDFRWQAFEAGQVLARHALAHPDKQVVRVELLIPKGQGRKPLVYRYFREQNRVVFGELLDDVVYVSEPISGGVEAMAAGKLDLGQDAVKLCSRPRSSSDDYTEWCPWADPYGQAAREAARKAKR